MAIMYHLLHLPMCVRQEKQLEPNVCGDNVSSATLTNVCPSRETVGAQRMWR